jgi:hypothetical protein
MLDGALQLMKADAISGMKRFLAVGAVAKAAEVAPSSARLDWEDQDGFLLDLAGERLFSATYTGIDDVFRHVIVSYADGLGHPREQFVSAIATNFEKVLQLPTTVPSWQLHGAAATAYREDGDTTPVDRTAEALCELRRAFYKDLSDRYVDSLRTVLLDLGRRPKPGYDEAAVLGLIHTFFNGAVLRHLVDPDAFPEGGRTVGEAALAMLEGLTEPDLPSVEAGTDADLPTRVRGECVRQLLERPRSGSPGPEALDELVERLAESLGQERDEVRSAFEAAYPSIADVWDAALRHLLQRRVEQVWLLHEGYPGAVLMKLARNLLHAQREHPVLVASCVASQESATSPYLVEIAAKVTDLMGRLDAADPGRSTRQLLVDCLAGDNSHVESLLGEIVGDPRLPGARGTTRSR